MKSSTVRANTPSNPQKPGDNFEEDNKIALGVGIGVSGAPEKGTIDGDRQLDAAAPVLQPGGTTYGKPPGANLLPDIRAMNAAEAAALQQAGLAPPQLNAPSGSIMDMPDEVKKNIVGYDDLELDEMLQRILGSFTAAITCDRIIQLLWANYKRTPTRTKVLYRLRLLAEAEAIIKAPGTKSMYRSLPPLLTVAAGEVK